MMERLWAQRILASVLVLQAEAMGGSAGLEITAVSSQEAPQFAPRDDLSCSKKFDAILKEKLDVVQLWAGRAESSASEQGYKTMANETFDVFLASFHSQQTCRVVSSDALIEITLDFQKKQEASKPDSRARKLYESMIAKLGKFIPTQYRKELATKNLTFRQADSEGHKFHKQFVTSKPDSTLKGTYQEMSQNAYALAEQALMKEVKTLDNEKTYQLIVEFQAKYNDPANYPQETMMKYLVILSERSNFLRSIVGQ